MEIIKRSAKILELLSQGTNRLVDLSRGVGLSKSTTHRILRSLEAVGFVNQNRSSHYYYLGPKILNLASNPTIGHQNLVACAFEQMRFIQSLTRETVTLHIQVGTVRMCLEEIPSFQEIRYSAGRGTAAPIYTGSSGKILLSQLNDKDLQDLFEKLRLTPVGPNTITDKKTLLNEIYKARMEGYATSFGERIEGSASISVAIEGYVYPLALSVLGPQSRFPLSAMMAVLGELRKSAKEISRKLGRFSDGVDMK
jgi:DNA-binding IclR family transcriptional regulator